MSQGNNKTTTPNNLKVPNKRTSNGDGGTGNVLQKPNNLTPTS